MQARTAAARRPTGLVPFLLLLVLVVAGCSPERYPQTALLPLSDFARIGDHVQNQTFYWAVGVFMLVEGALLYAIFRFRGGPDDPEPPQIHGNTTLEIVWTIIPALILAVIAVPTVQDDLQDQRASRRATCSGRGDRAPVVVGVPLSRVRRHHGQRAARADRPDGRSCGMNTADVIHSFWVPQFAGKRDVFPNRQTRLWFKAESAGELPGPVRRVLRDPARPDGVPGGAQTPAEFDAWVANMQTLGPSPRPRRRAVTRSRPRAPAGRAGGPRRRPRAPVRPTRPRRQPGSGVRQGRSCSQTKGCIGCHSLRR